MTDLQVIGAGLGRTGTMALKLALEQLGFDPCHHMSETFKHPERNMKLHLQSILFDDNSDRQMEAMFGGYRAVVDYPGCLFYERLMEMNPEAKVVLTVRDSPDIWVKSVRDTIFCMHAARNRLSWKLMELIRPFVTSDFIPVLLKIMESKQCHGVNPIDPTTDLNQMYTDWIERVQDTVPCDRLLIFNVKQGWKPLCDFLGVPVPDVPFPRTNSGRMFWKLRWKYLVEKSLPKIVMIFGLFVMVFSFSCSSLLSNLFESY